MEHPIEPGRLVLPHVHLHEDEYSYILEGTIGARVGDHEVVAGPGSYLFKPRALMHTFWNAGPGHARILEVIAPAGFAVKSHIYGAEARSTVVLFADVIGFRSSSAV